MECFNGFWSRRLEATRESPWFIGGVDFPKIAPPQLHTCESLTKCTTVLKEGCSSYEKYVDNILVENTCERVNKSFISYKRDNNNCWFVNMDKELNDDLRGEIKARALKHRDYYKTLCVSNTSNTDTIESVQCEQMAEVVSSSNEIKSENLSKPSENLEVKITPSTLGEESKINVGKETSSEGTAITIRHRRAGVFELGDFQFQSVKVLAQKYQKMYEETTKKLKEGNAAKSVGRTSDKEMNINKRCQSIDEVHLLPPPSGYCSSSASGGSDDERERNYCERTRHVKRCGSSDSAVGLTPSDDEAPHINWSEQVEQKSVYSPYSPRGSVDHTNVPTRTLIESQCVPYPIDRKFSDCVSEGYADSRRHSIFTDDGDDSRCRYFRTPSVVVSDYSDDMIGLTLEDIEYFRNQRKETSSSPESSLHSSCSNLNYCGSSISNLDCEHLLRKPYRKSSDCSLYSFSGDEDGDNLQPHVSKEKGSGWRKLRNIVQWTPFFQTYKKQRYPWVQLAGHQGNFKAGPDQGTILKKLCAKEEKCFKILMNDRLRPYVPEYKGLITSDDGECSYLQLQDLLGDFVSPCVMDCKIGVRTYLEEELAKAKEKPKLRKDMYEKMCQIDGNAPTEEEHRLKGVTKPRYMVWRETISSTATLGFRIEGIRKSDGTSSKDFKTTKSKDQIMKAFGEFTEDFPHAIPKYIQRLKAIKATLESSEFFNSHEVIGSSLLFVHDRCNANVWLIDFAKTIKLPEEIKIDHNSKWTVGNHEDGYLIGINNLISIFMTMLEQQPVPIAPPRIHQDDHSDDELQPNLNE